MNRELENTKENDDLRAQLDELSRTVELLRTEKAKADKAVIDLQKQLLESEATNARYERIFAGAQNYGFMDWDLTSNENYWGGQFWQSLGYNEEDITRLSKTEHFMDFVHPEDRIFLTDALMDHFHGKPHERTTFRVVKKSGGYVWAEARGESERDGDGRIRFMSGLLFDINDLKGLQQRLKKSEERFARIVSASNEGYWEWTAEGNAYLFSPNCWAHLGYECEEELFVKGEDMFQSWRSKVHPEDLPDFDRTLRKQMQDREPIDFEYRIQAKDGSWRWLRVRGGVVFDERNRPSIMSGINIDVTELRVAQAKEAEARLLAERASQSKSRFLSSMSHELRTPLNAVIGFAQLLERDTQLGQAQRWNAERIHRAGDHLLTLIGNVLDLEKIDANVMDLDCQDCEAEPIISDALMMVRDSKSANDITFSFNPEKQNNALIQVDPNRLRQVLINLISNASKYNREDGLVHIEQKVLSKQLLLVELGDSSISPLANAKRLIPGFENWMRISVTDTGAGIPSDKRQQLFTPYHRLGKEKGRVQGTGIGLTIALQLVRKMNGIIWYESEEGVGSTFSVAFPAAVYSPSPASEVAGLDPFNDCGQAQSNSATKQAPTFKEDLYIRFESFLKNAASRASFDSKDAQPVEALRDSHESHLRVLHVEDNPINLQLIRSFCSDRASLALYESVDATSGLYMSSRVQPHLLLLDIELPDFSGYDLLTLLDSYAKSGRLAFKPFVVAVSANALKEDIDRAMTLGFDGYLTKPVDLAQLDRLFTVAERALIST